jgi:diguanylate cyclase (GGDEF)-like protein
VAKDRLDRLIPIVLDLIKAEESQYRDALTGGYSADGIKRRYYIERDRAKINHSEEDPKETVLIEFDVDSFKGINDTHGHHAGDLILKAVIEKLRATLRATDAIGRRSGDEFSVILSQVRKEEVQTVLQKMVAAVQEILNPAGEPISVTGGARIIESTEEIHFEKASEEADTAGVHQKIANPGTIALSSTDYSLDLDTAEKRVDWATKVAKRKLKRLIDPFYAQLSKPDILPENKKNVEQQVDLYETHVLPTMVQIELLQIENEYGKLL